MSKRISLTLFGSMSIVMPLFSSNAICSLKEVAICLYYLDVDLRNILSKCINRIEISFRTQVIYYVSNKYRDSPTWFIDGNILNSNFIKDIDKFYNDSFILKNKPIKKLHQKYLNDKYAPAWKTLEFFFFWDYF